MTTRRELKREDIVRSADGALYWISYIHPATGNADLHPFNPETLSVEFGEDRTLHVGELKRIPDPRNRKPPVEGMPAERPRCQCCDRPFRFTTHNEWEKRSNGASVRIIRRTFARWNNYRDTFCTLRCALDFAMAAHRAGYRIVRKGDK